jgi:hypothetical protein
MLLHVVKCSPPYTDRKNSAAVPRFKRSTFPQTYLGQIFVFLPAKFNVSHVRAHASIHARTHTHNPHTRAKTHTFTHTHTHTHTHKYGLVLNDKQICPCVSPSSFVSFFLSFSICYVFIFPSFYFLFLLSILLSG